MDTGLSALQLTYSRNEKILFRELSLAVKPGQGLLVYGPNGSGKTSLLRLLAGLISPTEGSVLWNQRDLQDNRLDYHQALHFLGHGSGVKSKLSLLENLGYSQTLNHQNADEETWERVLSSLALWPLRNQLAQQLSAGQKRRLALARLLAFPKPLWILDEPFTNLDAAAHAWLLEALEKHLKNQGLFILASHQAVCLQSVQLKTVSLPCSAEAAHV